MELQLLINGQKCEIKFEKHHNFDRVLKVLKQNKVLSFDVSFDTIDIIGKDGRQYNRSNLIIQSLIPPETNKCEVKLKFSNSDNKSSVNSNKDSISDSPGVKKARLVDIIKNFFEKMQKHEFKKLQKYKNHQEQIVSLVAQFAGKYEKLYALNLCYKQKLMNLNKREEQQLEDFGQKFKDIFKINEQQMNSNFFQSIRIQSIQQPRSNLASREVIDQRDELIKCYENKLEQNKFILQETVDSYKKEVEDLKLEITSCKKQIQQLQTNKYFLKSKIEQMNELTLQLQSQLQFKQQLNNQCNETINKMKNCNAQMEFKLQVKKDQLTQVNNQYNKVKQKLDLMLNQQKSQKLQEIQSQLQIKQKECAQLYQKIQTQKILKASVALNIELLQKQNENLKRKLQLTENQLEKVKNGQNSQIINNLNLGKLSSILFSRKKSSYYLEEIDYQPISKLNECFSSDLAKQFLAQIQLYINRSLNKLIKMLYHPFSMAIQKKKILKKLKGKQNILVICLTQQDRVVGGFSSLPIDSLFSPKQIRASKAFLFNIQNNKINLFKLKEDQRPLRYDQDFFILGQEELTIDYQDMTLSSRFVDFSSKSKTSFQDPKQRRKYLLSPQQKSSVKIKEYWLFHCIFE